MESDSAGVVLVSLPGGDGVLPWTFERILEIGPAEEEAQGFLGVADVAAIHSASGVRIGVLDAEGKQVLLYDVRGDLLARTGREGSGPGEFQYPLTITAEPDGGVGIFDLLKGKLERFGPDLELLPSEPFRFSYTGGPMAFAGPYLLLETGDWTDESEGRLEALTAASGTDTVLVARFDRERGGVVELQSCGMSLSGMPPIFAPGLEWAANRRGMVAVAGTGRYEIDIYRQPSFTLERRIRREVPVMEATEAMARASVGENMKLMTPGGYRVCEAGEVVQERGFAPVVPPIAALALSPEGRIWVQRWAPEGEGRSVDVLAPNGAFLGTLESGSPFPEAFLDEDRIVVREEDELGLPSVVVFQIQR